MSDSKRILAGLLVFMYIFSSLCIANEPSEKKNLHWFNDSVQFLLNESNKYISASDYDKSIKIIYKIYQLRLKQLPANDPQIAYSLSSIGSVFNYLGEPDSALVYLNKAEKVLLSNKSVDPIDLADLYAIMSSIYRNKGEATYSEYYFMLAEKKYLAKKTNKINLNIARLYIGYLLYFTEFKDFTKSNEYIKKANIAVNKLSDNEALLIQYYLRVAQIEAARGNFNKSIDYQQEAIKIFNYNKKQNYTDLFPLYNNIGLDYLDLKQYDNALIYFNKALDLKKFKGIIGPRLANLYINYSYYFNITGNLQQSLAYTQLALKTLVPEVKINEIENPDFKDIPISQLSIEILKAKSKVLYKLYLKDNKIEHLDESINTGFIVLSLIEELRNGYLTYESKLTINEHEDETFKSLADQISKAYIKTGDNKYLEFAFDVSERNKSSLLRTSLGELKAKKFGEIPENLLNKEKYLNKRIAFYKEQIYEEKQLERPDNTKMEVWQEYLVNAEKDHKELIEKFETEYPKYYKLKYGSKNYNFKELQNNLPQNASIIEYTLTDSLLHIIVISDHLKYYTVSKIDSSFFKLVTDYLSEFQNFDFSRQYYSSFTEFCWKSKELYTYLINPISSVIKNEKLIIVPDGILSFIPFETLIDQIPQTVSNGYFKELPYLIKDYDISYSYSATLFNTSLSTYPFKRIKKLLAFAPVYNSKEINLDNYRGNYTRQQYRKNLFPIPGAKEEVEAISRLIKSDLYIGVEATETRFKETADQYDILHLAMHTVIDNKNPLYSKLIFTLNADSINDGLMNTYEIFGLNLNARMVVLSACSTGEGEYSKGEGALSLARGFSYAGVPALVMTLWEVEDKSGSVLMKNFYINLLKGQSKSRALRNAKLKFIIDSKMENSHPFFWSSFVLVGNPSSIHTSNYIFISFGLALIILIIWIYFLFKKKRATASLHS